MINVDRSNVEDKLSRSERTAVLFYADWCPYCRAFKPKFEAYAKKTKTELAEANISDEGDPLWDKFRVEVIPTVVVFSRGKQVARADGKAGIGLGEADLERVLKESDKR